MYRHIEDFANAYTQETQISANVMSALTDEGLGQEKVAGDWTAGQLAWHICTSPYDIVNQFGCEIPTTEKPESLTAQAILTEQARAGAATIEAIKSRFTDADMSAEVSAFGWPMPLGAWLHALVCHEIHHRGQLSILMRQAGLTVPNIYGPNKEETAKYMEEHGALPH